MSLQLLSYLSSLAFRIDLDERPAEPEAPHPDAADACDDIQNLKLVLAL
jgi:hypothetical protein